MKKKPTPLTWIFGLLAILAGINVQATAQTYTSFDADPHATFPYQIDSLDELWELLSR